MRQPPCRRRTASVLVLPALLAGLLAGCRGQAEYPQRPVMLICPWSAGGGTDRVSRQVAAQLERELGVPVNVVNATGGGGVTGHTRGALARPDGYTLTMITPELNMLHWRGLTSISHRDFEPLLLVNRDDAALFVRADAPYQSAAELARAVRERPRSLRASGTAFGGIWHLAVAGWLNAAGLRPSDVIWVSINGAAPSLQDLLAGGVDFVCCSVPEAQTLLDAGQVRCLAVMGEQRFPGLPEVPTLAEQGLDWSVRGWRGLALPRGVPPDRADKLLHALRRVAASEEYRRFLDNAGFGAAVVPTDQFAAHLEREDAVYGAMLTSEDFRGVRRQRFGPLFFPAIIGVLLAAVVIALLATGGLRLPHADAAPLSAGGLSRVALGVATVVLYAVASEWLGYLAAASLVLLLLLRGLRVRWAAALAVTVLLVPATYQVFAVWLRVPLPRGGLEW